LKICDDFHHSTKKPSPNAPARQRHLCWQVKGSLLSKTARREEKSQNRFSQISLPYSAAFKDHLANPRNAGELSDATHVAERINPVCGDRLHLFLRIHDERIEAARFLAYGCPPTLACGSALTEMIKGLSREEALRLTRRDIIQQLQFLPARKQHAAALAIETLHAALEEF
jgi:nitrogen fixation NifU-like protein